MVEFANQQLRAYFDNAYTIIVNGLRHPRLPTHLEYDTNLRGEGFARAKTVLALAHQVSR